MKGLLVGYGSIGRRHLANFHGLGVDEWAVVHTGMGTLPLEPPCPVTTYADLVSALRHEEPTFAVIANPTNLHVPTMLACIEAGCHVLVEKPVSHTLDGLDALEGAARQHGRGVLVGFQFRFHPALKRIRALLESRVIGAPLHAQVVWGEYLPGWHPWEDWRISYAARLELGGGVHHTICHPLDYLRMLFGDATAVLASLSDHRPLGLDVPEAADVFLRFGHGVAAQVHLDYWSRPTQHRVDIFCTGGTIRWDYITGEFKIWSEANESWQPEEFPSVDDRNDLFVAEASHFLEVIEGGAQPACTLQDGIAAVRLCAMIERSDARKELALTQGP
jgi:predicted dehydrogenase